MAYTGYSDIANFYDRVRAAIKLDSSTLSDSAIDYPENAKLAEKQIKKRVTGWAALTAGDDITDLETAIVLQTAINCHGAYVNGSVKVKQSPNVKIEYNQTETSLLADLIEKVNEIIIVLTGGDEDIFYGFMVT